MHSVPRGASLRTLIVAVVLAIAAAVSATPAQATCTANIQGIVVTDNAGYGQPAACPSQVGRPDGTGTGRKVG